VELDGFDNHELKMSVSYKKFFEKPLNNNDDYPPFMSIDLKVLQVFGDPKKDGEVHVLVGSENQQPLTLVVPASSYNPRTFKPGNRVVLGEDQQLQDIYSGRKIVYSSH